MVFLKSGFPVINDFIELSIQISDFSQYNDIVISWLAGNDFEGFWEKDDCLVAYIPEKDFNPEIFNDVRNLLPGKIVRMEWNVIPEQNWNKIWESRFEPVIINNICMVRASHHPADPGLLYDIIIEPKMSFGTRHHETTALMIELMLDIDFKDKTVLDMGCGTGILAILAKKMGAGRVLAIDNDVWAYKNALENIEHNNINDVEVILGHEEEIKNKSFNFDIIFANINYNIILNNMHHYAVSLRSGGLLLLSGFYRTDLSIINKKAKMIQLQQTRKISKNDWLAVQYIKTDEF